MLGFESMELGSNSNRGSSAFWSLMLFDVWREQVLNRLDTEYCLMDTLDSLYQFYLVRTALDFPTPRPCSHVLVDSLLKNYERIVTAS